MINDECGMMNCKGRAGPHIHHSALIIDFASGRTPSPAPARRGGAELCERRAAVRRPELDAAPVVFGGRGRGGARGGRLWRRLRRGGRLRLRPLCPGGGPGGGGPGGGLPRGVSRERRAGGFGRARRCGRGPALLERASLVRAAR